MQRLNLLPRPRVVRRRVRQRLALWSAAVSTAWLIAGGGIALVVFTPDGDGDGTRRMIAAAEADLAEERASAAASARAVERMGVKLEVAKALERRRDRSALLITLGELVGDGVVLTQLDVQSSGAIAPATGDGAERPPDRVTIAGTAMDQAEVTGFMLRLESTRTLEAVELRSTRRVDFGSGQTVDFSIEGELAAGTRGEA